MTKVSYFKLFLSFFKIGMFTLGGGYAMLPLIQREVVEKNRWMDDETFVDGLAAAQACPGPIAVNLSVYAGYHIAGGWGMALAVLGTVLPSFLIILLIAVSFSDWANQSLVQKIFKGLRPAVTALIAVPVIQIAQKAKIRWHRYWLPLAAIILIVFYGVSPVYLIVFTILLAWAKYLYHSIHTRETVN
jgi:chromate transporter